MLTDDLMARGVLCVLNAPWHRSHGKEVIIMDVEEGRSDEFKGQPVALILEQPIGFSPLPNRTEEFAASLLEPSPRFETFRSIVEDADAREMFDVIHRFVGECEDTEEDVGIDASTCYVTSAAGRIDIVYGLQNPPDPTSMTLAELICLLHHYDLDEDGTVLFRNY